MTLSDDDVAILMTLWEAVHGRRGDDVNSRAGLDRDALEARLVARDGSRPFRTRATLNKHLSSLKKFKDLLSVDLGAAKSRKGSGMKQGDNRDIYRLAEMKVISWPETARIVMTVWNSPGNHIDRESLVEAVLSLKLRKYSSMRLMSRDDVLLDVDFALANQYLNTFGDELRAEARMRFELPYLTEVSARAIVGDSEDSVRDRSFRGGASASG